VKEYRKVSHLPLQEEDGEYLVKIYLLLLILDYYIIKYLLDFLMKGQLKGG